MPECPDSQSLRLHADALVGLPLQDQLLGQTTFAPTVSECGATDDCDECSIRLQIVDQALFLLKVAADVGRMDFPKQHRKPQ